MAMTRVAVGVLGQYRTLPDIQRPSHATTVSGFRPGIHFLCSVGPKLSPKDEWRLAREAKRRQGRRRSVRVETQWRRRVTECFQRQTRRHRRIIIRNFVTDA